MAMSEGFSPPDIQKSIGVLSTSKSGWNLELNFVSWGGRPAKYDIRSWDSDHQKMGKGVTFTKEELSALKNLLNEMQDL
ncbi:YdbC family protein [Treponema sp.]|uniref:YdbC family protein n=1 Tax=Treponema sp. TaxID=166 RepID=UPI003F0C6988